MTVLSSTAALARCAEYGDSSRESMIWRFCPGGVAFERQRIYFGVWGDWTRVHPNVTPPCAWNASARTWQCRREARTIACTDNQCR